MNTFLSPARSLSLRARASRRSWSLLAVVLVALAVGATSAQAAEPGFRHTYLMRGQVLAQKDNTLVLCIGKTDGAQVGQVLDVVRHVRTSLVPRPLGPSFRPEDVGQARITTVFNEHYSEATVLEGKVKVGDVVQLTRSP